jgi:hypothetical protein
MTQITIEMPERDSYGEIMKGYFSLMRGFGIELGMRCDAVLSDLDSENWWNELVAQRRAEQENRWKGSVNPNDPGLVLPEYVWRLDSPIAKALSSKPQSRVTAKKIQTARNSWLHFTTAPGPAELQEVAVLVKQFASLNDLKIGAMATRMINRLQRIRTGQYQPFGDVIAKWRVDNPTTEPAAAAAADTAGGTRLPTEVEQPFHPDPTPETIEVEAPAIERRPAIGARWSGEIPTARFVPSAIGDLVDPSTGEGLRAQVGPGLWLRKRRLWLAARPLGGVWVDDRDGAVGGFVDNVSRLLGYLGDEPDDGLARGFLTPHYYEVDGDRIVDLDSGIALLDAVPVGARDQAAQLQAEVFAATTPHAGLRLSTYGDLVAVTDEGAVRVAVVEPENWFAGHLT